MHYRWDDFKCVMDEKESKILRAFTAMEVAPSGILELNRVKAALHSVGLPATDDNARAMLTYVVLTCMRVSFQTFSMCITPQGGGRSGWVDLLPRVSGVLPAVAR